MIKKLKQFYFYNLSLSKKLLISYFILLALPTLAVSIFLYGEIYNLVIEKTIQNEQILAEQSVAIIESSVRYIMNTSNIIKNDSYLNHLLALDQNSKDLESIVNTLNTSFLQSLINYTENSDIEASIIKKIKIYYEAPQTDLYMNDDIFLSLEKVKGTYWYGILKNATYDSLHCPTFYLSPNEISHYGNTAYIQKLYMNSGDDNSLNQVVGYLAIYYNQESLNEILRTEFSIDDSITYMINSRSSVTATSDTFLLGTYYMSYDSLKTLVGNPRTFTLRRVLDNQVYVSYYPVANTDWFLISVIPATPLLSQVNRVIINFILFYAAFLSIAFIVSLVLSQSIAKRISTVSDAMGEMRSGKLSVIANNQGKDEIASLTDTYNYMVEKLDHLLDAQQKSAEQLRTSEFQALQAQINPHFLYNTLDMINWLSQSGKNSQVTQAVQNLSKFYKLTLSKSASINTIEQELEHISLYVKLQNMRFQNKIDFLIDIPDEFLEYSIPKLTFQPIVENAIQHGILEKETKEGIIVITAWQEENSLVFLISDNGIGMELEKLSSILAGNESSKKKGSNIGIFNTHQRLQILYGPSYGLSYASQPSLGTEVTIRIPPTPTA